MIYYINVQRDSGEHIMHLRLKEIRLKRGLTQKEVADVIGCSAGAYSKYEVGDREPSLDVLDKLADYYDVSVDYLIGRAVTSSSALSNKEMQLIEKYRSSDRFVRESTLEIMELLDNNFNVFSGHTDTKKRV